MLARLMWPNGKLYAENRPVDSMTNELTWHWNDGPVAMVRMEDLACHFGCKMFRIPDKMLLGPYWVRVLRHQPWMSALWVVRDNWYAPFVVFADRIWRSLEIVNITLIRLCHIWRLAEHEEGARYSWRELYAVKWVRRLMKKGTATP